MTEQVRDQGSVQRKEEQMNFDGVDQRGNPTTRRSLTPSNLLPIKKKNVSPEDLKVLEEKQKAEAAVEKMESKKAANHHSRRGSTQIEE